MNHNEQWMEEERIQWIKPRAPVSVYLRFGKWGSRPRSINFHTGETERGLSVYRAEMVSDGVVRLAEDDNLVWDVHDYAEMLEGRLVFAVTGKEVGKGSDGEPLITTVKLLPYAIEYESFPKAFRKVTA